MLAWQDHAQATFSSSNHINHTRQLVQQPTELCRTSVPVNGTTHMLLHSPHAHASRCCCCCISTPCYNTAAVRVTAWQVLQLCTSGRRQPCPPQPQLWLHLLLCSLQAMLLLLAAAAAAAANPSRRLQPQQPATAVADQHQNNSHPQQQQNPTGVHAAGQNRRQAQAQRRSGHAWHGLEQPAPIHPRAAAPQSSATAHPGHPAAACARPPTAAAPQSSATVQQLAPDPPSSSSCSIPRQDATGCHSIHTHQLATQQQQQQLLSATPLCTLAIQSSS